MSAMPPPPPPVVPVPDVDEARASMASSKERLEEMMRRSSTFTDDERRNGVNDEWSTVESLRHLVLVIDLWLSKVIRGVEDPFHPMALPPSFMPAKLPGSSIDPDANPTFEEACDVLRARLADLDRYIGALTREELDREVPAHAKTVGGALNVIFTELNAHDHFINRDLDIIESSRP